MLRRKRRGTAATHTKHRRSSGKPDGRRCMFLVQRRNREEPSGEPQRLSLFNWDLYLQLHENILINAYVLKVIPGPKSMALRIAYIHSKTYFFVTQ